LEVAAGVGIDSHVKVVLVLPHLYDCVQVATLEVAVELQLLTLLNRRVHAPERRGVFGFEVAVELPEVGGHMLVVGAECALVLEEVVPAHFLVHLEAAGESETCLVQILPR
jgi:hypothetical protein